MSNNPVALVEELIMYHERVSPDKIVTYWQCREQACRVTWDYNARLIVLTYPGGSE